MAEEKTLLKVSASCDSPTRLPLFLRCALCCRHMATLPHRLACSWGDRSASIFSQSSVLPLPKAQYLQKNGRAKVHVNSATLQPGRLGLCKTFYSGFFLSSGEKVLFHFGEQE